MIQDQNTPSQTTTTEPETFAGLKVEGPPTDLTETGVNMILLGPAGSGKTTLAASAAYYEGGRPTLFVDAEGGFKVLAGMSEDIIQKINISSWPQLERFRREAIRQANNLPWKTIVFDNLSELASLARESEASGDKVTQPEWGRINNNIIQFVRTFRDLSRNNPVNVIFIAWDKLVEQEDTGKLKRNLALTPQLYDTLPGMVDIIGHVKVLPNHPIYTRVVSFAPNPSGIGKFRKALGSPAQEIPHEIFYGVDDMPMPAILATLKEGKKWDKTKYLPPKGRPTATNTTEVKDNNE